MVWVIEPRTAVEHTLNKLDPQIAGLFLTFLCELASKLENPTVIGKALSGVRPDAFGRLALATIG